MNEIFQLNTLFLTQLNVADNKITKKIINVN